MVWKQLAESNGDPIPVNHFVLLKNIPAHLSHLFFSPIISCDASALSRKGFQVALMWQKTYGLYFLFRSAIMTQN